MYAAYSRVVRKARSYKVRTWEFIRTDILRQRTDFRWGWICWEWAWIVYSDLYSDFRDTDYFKMEMVGHVSNLWASTGPRPLKHSWVTVRARSREPGRAGFYRADLESGWDCVVHLDPWAGKGDPVVYTHDEHLALGWYGVPNYMHVIDKSSFPVSEGWAIDSASGAVIKQLPQGDPKFDLVKATYGAGYWIDRLASGGLIDHIVGHPWP